MLRAAGDLGGEATQGWAWPDVILAMYYARQAVKQEWRAEGRRLFDYSVGNVTKAAEEYLTKHPELIEKARESARNHLRLRTLAEREARERRRNRR